MSEEHRDDLHDQPNENTDSVNTQPTDSNPSFDELKNKLSDAVPTKLESTVPNTPSEDEVESLIVRYNDKSVEILKDAKLAAIWSFVKNESERTKRQKPLLYIVAIFTAIQLIAFNVIIAAVAWFSFQNSETDVITQLFDILKYYIGATVVELISMLAYITSGTFSTNHVKTMELLLKNGTELEHQNGNDPEKVEK